MKKGVIFSLDAFLAVALFLIVVVSIYTSVLDSGNIKQQYYLSNDMLNILSSIEVEYFEDSYVNLHSIIDENEERKKVIGGALLNLENNEISSIINEIFSENLIGSRYGVGIKIENEDIVLLSKKYVVARTIRIPSS